MERYLYYRIGEWDLISAYCKGLSPESERRGGLDIGESLCMFYFRLFESFTIVSNPFADTLSFSIPFIARIQSIFKFAYFFIIVPF